MRGRSRGSMLGAALCAVLATAALIVVLEAGAAAPSAASTPRPAASTAVGVSAREFRLTPYRTRIPVGEIRFNVTNFGEDRHDLVVRTPAGRVVARSPVIRAGDRTTLSVRLRAGRYRLSCDVSGHAALGMRATIAVTRPRPSATARRAPR